MRYSMALRFSGVTGLEPKLVGNLYDVKDISDNDYLDWRTRVDKRFIKGYAFRIKKDCDCLGGAVSKSDPEYEGTYGFVQISFYDDALTIAEQNIKHFKKGLAYWSEPAEYRSDPENCFFSDPYTTTYESAEYPYKMYFMGCDDSTYTKCFRSLEEVHRVLELIADEHDGIDAYAFMEELKFESTN